LFSRVLTFVLGVLPAVPLVASLYGGFVGSEDGRNRENSDHQTTGSAAADETAAEMPREAIEGGVVHARILPLLRYAVRPPSDWL
jgi:hypothetical protein